jgi:hypothetical protein
MVLKYIRKKQTYTFSSFPPSQTNPCNIIFKKKNIGTILSHTPLQIDSIVL